MHPAFVQAVEHGLSDELCPCGAVESEAFVELVAEALGVVESECDQGCRSGRMKSSGPKT